MNPHWYQAHLQAVQILQDSGSCSRVMRLGLVWHALFATFVIIGLPCSVLSGLMITGLPHVSGGARLVRSASAQEWAAKNISPAERESNFDPAALPAAAPGFAPARNLDPRKMLPAKAHRGNRTAPTF